MCLFLKKIPYSFGDTVVLKTQKVLAEKLCHFETPYQYTKVNNNGMIFNSEDYEDFYYGDNIHGEAVHSYSNSKCTYRQTYNAYALGVFGFGNRDYWKSNTAFEVASIGLYIPIADTKHKQSMVSGLNAIIKCGKDRRFDRLIKLLEKCNIDTTKFHNFKKKWHKYND